jgi:endo-1,4-beta-xylanase
MPLAAFFKTNKFTLTALLFAFIAIASIGCKPKQMTTSAGKAAAHMLDTKKGLKDYYKRYFKIGVAVNMAALKGADSALVVKEFNSVTPENDMKMGPIHPKENEYNFKNADAIVNFAVKHHIAIRGHNLLWHAQAPAWLFIGPDGKQVTKELLLQRLKDHITTVVKRYKGKIYAWDVVNEAIDDDSTKFMRNSLWYKICGDDFIPKAFEYAHAADPKAALYYNDYNSEHPTKRENIYKLLKSLVDARVPITGVGMQGHWKLDDPTPELLRKALDEFSSLGLKIQVTELDITIRKPMPRQRPGTTPPTVTAATTTPPVPDAGFTPELEQRQIDQYKMVFDIFRQYKSAITCVTFWNLSDRYSWLDSRGGGLLGGAAASAPTTRVVRKAYPLLFDTNLQRKKAYWAVVDF